MGDDVAVPDRPTRYEDLMADRPHSNSYGYERKEGSNLSFHILRDYRLKPFPLPSNN